jgi:hypothetical protein
MSISGLGYAPDVAVVVESLDLADNSSNRLSLPLDLTWTTAGAPVTPVISFQRIGSWVTIDVAADLTAVGNAGVLISDAGAVPLQFRVTPTAIVTNIPWVVEVAGIPVVGKCFVNAAGQVGFHLINDGDFVADAAKTGAQAGAGSYYVG